MSDPTGRAEGGPRFTPGPWRVAGGDRCDAEIVCGDGTQENHIVCIGHDYDQGGSIGAPYPKGKWNEEAYDRESMANAQLIAAAPDLYAACRSVADWLSSFSMPPTATIAEKDEQLKVLEAAIARAEGQ